jgi:hypothetical protein
LVERKLFYTWVTATFGAFEESVSVDVLEYLMPHGKPDAYVAKVVQHWRTGKRFVSDPTVMLPSILQAARSHSF